DHRHIKRITSPMGGFRKLHTAARTIAGIELMNMIKKGQLNFTKHIDQNLTPAQQFYRLATI
ncbi:MAG: DDE-type integrase/transposase/recombinase, partial [Alphaproteobacteria bacterium]|nr:DDE-type integrase/transposase/recombinase [Alphaproteobacteria bacterium]